MKLVNYKHGYFNYHKKLCLLVLLLHKLSLLDDESKRQKMGNEGRKFVEKNYNWDLFNNQLAQLFKDKQGNIE